MVAKPAPAPDKPKKKRVISNYPHEQKKNKKRGSGHDISFRAEVALWRVATSSTDKKERDRALEMLVALDLPFISGLAIQVAGHVIHKKHKRDKIPDEQNLTSVGVTVFLEKLPKFDPKYGARLRNYAYLDMRRRMYHVACDGLEAVRNPRDARAHKAHRDIEAGMPVAEAAAKHGISLGVAQSLHRGTVSIDKLEEEGREISRAESPAEHADDQDGYADLLARVWDHLPELDRDVLCLLRLHGDDPKRRARAFEISRVDLSHLERAVFRRVRDLADEVLIGEVGGPVDPVSPEVLDLVWDVLEEEERGALVAHRLWPNTLWRRARAMGVQPHVARTLVERAFKRTRELVEWGAMGRSGK